MAEHIKVYWDETEYHYGNSDRRRKLMLDAIHVSLTLILVFLLSAFIVTI
jgi:hypothetical protein